MLSADISLVSFNSSACPEWIGSFVFDFGLRSNVLGMLSCEEFLYFFATYFLSYSNWVLRLE